MISKHLNVGCLHAGLRCRARWHASLIVVLAALSASDVAAQQTQSPQLIGGRNVNMAGGSQLLRLNPYEVRGDVLGRAQNEPSCAISTRNPQHVLCGANDYRMVDVPGVTQTQLIRDAWLGVFQSANGGDKWESTLLGGFFLDPAAHPLKTLKFQAAADPVVRSGLAGVTFYTGIAFTGDKSRSALHVTTYLDLNNSEQDDMPFKPVRTTVVHQVRAPQFIDKPWMYVEAGTPGQTCTLPVPNTLPPADSQLGRLYAQWLQMFPDWQPKAFETQVVPASTVHIVYTVFLDANDSTAAIMYTRSTNCGQTFSTPVRLNPTAVASVGLNDHGNGAAVAKPLASNSQTVVATWRRVRQTIAGSTIPDALVASVSTNNGQTWSQPRIIEQICPFDQGTTATSFRTTAFPSITADASGRFYVAWSDRRKPDGTCDFVGTSPDGVARIRIATSTDGLAWSSSIAVPSTTPEHQMQPSLTFNAGRLFLAWVDFADDASQHFGQFINEKDVFANSPAIRHTADVRASMALPGPAPDFVAGVTQISEYLKGVFTVGGKRVVGQLQWNAVNRRWARKGTVPFYGDYIDVATMPYLPPDPSIGRTTWTPNNQAVIQTPLGPVPVMPNLLIAWADNRDMRAAPGVDNAATTPVPYTTPVNLNLPATSIYDPTQMRPMCTPGNAYQTGTTNQNAYSSRLSIGFIAAAPGNNKDLGTLQRAFVVYVRNDSSTLKTFTLRATPPPGGFASFDQFDPSRGQRDVNVPARSSVARTVYVTRNPASSTPLNPDASVRVDVIELAGTIPVTAATVMLNADPSAPEIDSPEIDSREIFTPEIDSPEIDSIGFPSPEIDSPEIDSPEIDSPEIDSATWRALGLGTPEIDSPEIDSPEIDSPEIDSPEIDSPEIDSSAITDTKFRVRNLGNTTGEYNARAFVTPTAGADFRYQVIVRKTYAMPAVDANCQATTITVSKVAVNIKDVKLGTPEIDSPEIDSPEIDSPEIDSPEIDSSPSFYLAPGETAEVIVRTRSASGQTPPANAFNLAVQQAAVNSEEAAQGVTEPPVITTFLTVGTTAIPAAQPGTAYNTLLLSSGGTDPVTWTITQGGLPTGLALTAAGQIVGTPTVSGTFGFTVQATDSASPVQTATRSFSLIVTSPGVATLAFVNQPTTTVAGDTISPAPSVRAFNANGAPAAAVPVTVQLVGATGLQGTVTRTTGTTGVAVFNDLSIASLASGLRLTATAAGFTTTTSNLFGTVVSVSPTLTFTVQPSNVAVGAVMTPSVEVRALNSTGAAVPGVSVSLQLIGAGNLSGTLTRVTGATGVAIFNDLVMTTSGTGFALRALAAGYLTATSTTFDTGTTAPVSSPVAGPGVSTEPLIARPVQGLGGNANRDLVVVHSNGLVTRMGGNGTGQFSLMSQAPVAGMSGAPRDLRTGIVDGDGNADIVVAYDGANTNNLAILAGDGNFGLSQNQTYTVSIPGVPSAALVGQLNAAVDGVPDVAVLSRTTNQLLISETAQSFALRPAIPLPGSEPIAIASGQMNKDSDPWLDLVVLNRGSRNVTVLLGDGQGGFTSAGNFPLGAAGLRTPSDSPDALALADVNEDGRLDVVVATDAPLAEEGQAVIVLTGNGVGGLSAGVRHNLSAAAFAITTGDFDNDGHIDVASANPASNNLTVVYGTGTGGFSLPQALTAGNTPRGIVAADFTNDGRPDLVVTNRLQRPQSLTDEVTTLVNSASGNGALTVTSTADSGPGSLRQAIIAANARAGLDEISFAIPGAGPHVITLNTLLPRITDPIVIDGSTQPGYAGTPRVEIDGTGAGLDADGLWIANGYSEIAGLSLTGFLPGPTNLGGSAIVLAGPAGGSLVRANHIGLHASGAPIGAPTVGWGVTSGGANIVGVEGQSGRNVISGTSFTGVLMGGTGAMVMYNRFGTTPDGTASALPGQAQGTGVTVTGSNVFVWRNVIANQTGAYLNATATSVTVQDNRIGTDATGNVVLANPNPNSAGILIDGSGNLIGGSLLAEGNIIGGYGTGVLTRFGTGSIILNNRIGVGQNGASNLPNVWGIGLGSGGNVVNNNTITASSQAGVMITGATAQNNQITGNTITQNSGVGIGLMTTAGSGNNLAPNVFSQNGGLSIDLNFGDGPTANDVGDTDAGPNDLQNFPVVTGANVSGGSTVVSGALNSTASSTFIVSVFQNAGVCPASGRGEGQALLGSFAVVTDGAGNATFSTGLTGNVPVGAYLSATATNDAGSTSEFSPCFVVSAGPGQPALAFSGQPSNTAAGQTITPAVTVLATDATGAVLPGVAVTVTLVGSGTLSGTLTRTTGATGLAVFDDLSVSAAGNGKTLQAAAAGFLTVASAPFNVTSTTPPPVSNGLVSWWRGDNDALDSQGTNHGTLVNGATFGAGMFGQAFQLDGANDLVDVGPGFDLDALTLSAWVFVDTVTNVGNRTVLSKDDAGLVAVPADRRAFALMSSTNFSTLNNDRPSFTVLKGEPPSANAPGVIDVIEAPFKLTAGWHHLAGVRDVSAGRFEFYIDGALVGSLSPTVTGAIVSSVNVSATIGAVNTSYGAQLFNGRIDEPQIYNRALTAAEVATLYHHQSLVVTNTNDSGTGSLREAMLTANGIGGVQVPHITFNIPGAGPHVIAPTSPLPALNRPVVIDGSSQSGNRFVGIDGTAAGATANGLVITGGSSSVRGLAIGGFGGNGIVLQLGGGNQIAGNFLGTNLTGTAPSPIGGNVILIQDSDGNLIGGTVGTSPGGACTGDCNLIVPRGLDTAGVRINGSAGTSTNNRVLGNFIGVNALGTEGLGGTNTFGVTVSNAPNASIGDGTPAGRNVISGLNSGVLLAAQLASVTGNYIGTNSAGTAAPINTAGGFNNINFGITLAGADRATLVGNVVSGNGSGIALSGLGAQNNVVRGNFIGTNAAGTAAIPNTNNGLLIFNQSQNNIVGGATVADRNVISGNGTAGINLSFDPLVTNNRIIGNYIGTNAAGTVAIPNGSHGVWLDGAPANFIGGSAPGERNIISGNLGFGIRIEGAAINNAIAGNYIGTNAAGTAALGNAAGGVFVGASNTTIGGVTAAPGTGAGNVISGNLDGISIGTAALNGITGTAIRGNIVGLDASGNNALGNTITGIRTTNAGVIVGGAQLGARNVISGNQTGVSVNHGGSVLNTFIQGNYIGTDITGTLARGNTAVGLSLDSAPGTLVGGASNGGNLISGNGTGILIFNISEPTFGGRYSTIVQGNFIGLNAAGSLALGNTVGIQVNNDDNLLGGTAPIDARLPGGGGSLSGNTISGNTTAIELGVGASNNVVQNNVIGLNLSATAAIGNSSGVVLSGGATNNLVGGTTAAARNIITANVDGVVITGAGTSGNQVQGNFIGLNTAGTAVIGNSTWGVLVTTGAANNTIGGTAAGAGNVIAGQSQASISLNAGASNTVVQGNILGMNATGTSPLGNLVGVVIQDSSSNTIGGAAAGARNVISGSSGNGVAVLGTSAGNGLIANSIFNNGGLGIDLGGDGVTQNDANDTDIGPNTFQNFPVITAATATSVSGTLQSTANASFVVHVYTSGASDPSGFGEGQTLVATVNVTTDAGGNASFTQGGLTLTDGQFVTATATGAANNTSEFGASVPVSTALPVVTVSATDANASEVGPDPGTFTFTRTGSTAAPLNVNFTLTGTATPGVDYTNTIGISVTIPAGQSSTTASFTPLADALFEGNETVTITLAAGTYVIGASNTATATIADANPPVVTTFTVSSTNDSGPGSLRQAILDANTFGTVVDNIVFNIPGGGPQTIAPTSPLPAITQPVVIDGTTQPGFSGTPIIELNGQGAGATVGGLTISAGASTVRGLIINRFGGAGLRITGPGNNLVEGNFIGTNAAGTAALGNTYGVQILASSTNTVLNNVISGNAAQGVRIESADAPFVATGNVIRGNRIGTDRTGTTGIANGIGIWILNNGSTINSIGGVNAADGNIIAFNTGSGVLIDAAGSIRNSIQSNSIFNNGGLGIALGSDAVTQNDTNDTDSGPNNLQNFPVISAATPTSVSGTLQSTANTSFVVQVYTSSASDASGFGEGQTLVATVNVTTDAGGNASFTQGGLTLSAGQFITATATDASGNTSEFSASVAVSAAPVVTVVASDPTAAEAGPDPGSFTFTRTGSTTAPLNVNFTLTGTATVGVDYVDTIGILITIPAGQASATVNFSPVLDALIEANETVIVTLAAGSYVIGTPDTATVTIADNTPTVSVTASDPNAAEAGPDSGTFTFARTGPTVAPLNVTFTLGGTATNGVDYSTIGTLVTIPAGQSSITLNVSPLADALFEGPETVTVTITPGTYVIGASNAATVTIADANPPVVTTFTVSNTNDSGPGSLRQAILDANVFGTVTDNIFFNIPGAGVQTISPNSPLPTISQPVVIDARTQPAYSGTPLIELNGALAGANADGLIIASGGSVVAGLAINRWQNRAIVINGGANNTITANVIGTDPTGTIVRANAGTGAIHIIDSAGNVIGGNNLAAGNLIAGNSSNGVRIDGSLSISNFIEFNRIGVNAAGTALGNGISGVYVRSAPNTRINGNIVRFNGATSGVVGAVSVCGDFATCPGASFGSSGSNASTTEINNNVVTDNANVGVWIHGAPNTRVGGGTGGNNISGNGVGSTPSATHGVLISGVGATGTQVAGNSINGNVGAGLLIVGDGNTGNQVQGTTFVGNGGLAIDLGVSNNALVTGADGVTPNDAGDGDIGPNLRQNFPVITAALSGGLVQGTLNSTANSGFVLEFFASTTCTPGSAQRILGSGGALTDGAGNAAFAITLASVPLAGEFVTATATTSTGNTSEFSACVPVTVQPVVTITAPDPNAEEVGPNPGSFTVTRTGSTTTALVVHYAVSGTATNGVDYTTLPGTVTIPIGQTSATFPLDPLDDTVQESPESVILTLSSDAAYEIGTPSAAVAVIAGDANDTLLEVNNTNDSGPGSLRQAILDANAVTDLNAIFFQIPGTGPFTIQPITPLPPLTSPTYIFATTQPGYTTTPVIELSGALAGPNADGLVLAGGSSFVQGLAINRWSGRGVYIHGPGSNILTLNFIGTDVTGTIDRGNAGIAGVHIEDSSNNAVGGGSLGTANLISGNDGNGLRIDGALATSNVVYYNQIGVTPSGTALGNALAGIYIRAASNTQIFNNEIRFNEGPGGISVCGDGGACPGPALGTAGSNASTTLIYSNVISDNLNSGVTIRNSPSNVIGFTGFANTISNNGVGGTAPVSRVGVFVAGVGSTDNQIVSNTINGNTQGGVLIAGTGNTNNIVQGNTFSGNGGLAIDLGVTDGTLAIGTNGATPNDTGDADVGPNGYQNFPIITQVLGNGSVQGTLNSLPVNTYTIDFYGSATCTPGNAERFLGSTFVGTDGSGNATFNFTLTTTPNLGEFVRATATDSNGTGNTSEMSACVQAGPP